MSNEREIKKERKKERRKERIGKKGKKKKKREEEEKSKKGIKEEKTRCRSDDFRAKDRAVVSERRERKREEYRALVVVNNAL